MALHFLGLTSPPHSLSSLSLSNSNPSPKLPSSLSLSSKSSTHLIGTTQNSLHLNPNPSSFATRASISRPAAAEAAAATEEAVEISDRRRLIAQNIPWTCTVEDVKALFETHGTVLDVELSMYNKTRNRGLAFITMASEEDATAALNNLNSYDMDGRTIKIDYARSSKKNPPPEPLPTKKYNVYVGNLAWRVRPQDLRELFSASWKVISAEIVYQTNLRRPAGYGFVSFASEDDAKAAISTLNGKGFMGRPLRLAFSKTQTENIESIANEAEDSGEASEEVSVNGELAN